MPKSTNRGGSRKSSKKHCSRNSRRTLLKWHALERLPAFVQGISVSSDGHLSILNSEYSSWVHATPSLERAVGSRLMMMLSQFLSDNQVHIKTLFSPITLDEPRSAASKRLGRKRSSVRA